MDAIAAPLRKRSRLSIALTGHMSVIRGFLAPRGSLQECIRRKSGRRRRCATGQGPTTRRGRCHCLVPRAGLCPRRGLRRCRPWDREQLRAVCDGLRGSYGVYAVNPVSTSRYRDRHSSSGASDAGDAQVLSDMVRTDRHHHRLMAGDSEEVEVIKTLVRAPHSMVHHQALRALGNPRVGTLHGPLAHHIAYDEMTARAHRPEKRTYSAA
jgi:hypothetical protein